MKVYLPKRNLASGRHAYTLVEAIVAAVILGLVMISIFAGLTGGYSIINTFRQDMRATQILTQKTEFVRLCTWTQLNSLPSTFQDYYYSLASGGSASTNTTYYGTISVTDAQHIIPDEVSYYTNIDLVTINLTWTNYLGSHPIVHQRQMQTLVAYHGLVNYIYGQDFVQQ